MLLCVHQQYLTVMKRFSVLLVAFFMAIGFGLPASANTGAKTFIENVSNQALGVIKNGQMSTAQKEKKLASLFLASVDTDWTGKFALGKYAKGATPAQMKKYNSLYKKFLVGSYIPKFREYNNERLEILGVSQNENDFVVSTEIIRENNPSIKVDYRVRQYGGGYKVVDIIAEGVSLIATQRSEFGSVISNNGMDFLLERLTERVNQMGSMKPYLDNMQG